MGRRKNDEKDNTCACHNHIKEMIDKRDTCACHGDVFTDSRSKWRHMRYYRKTHPDLFKPRRSKGSDLILEVFKEIL